MKIVYAYGSDGVYIGSIQLNASDMSPLEDGVYLIPANCTEIEPPAAKKDKVIVFNGNGWTLVDVEVPVVEEAVPDVPSDQRVAVITMRQARLQLHAIGKLSAVQEAINQLSEPPKTEAQIEWDYAAVVERASPFVALLMPALDLSDEEMDELFIQASKL